MRTQFVLLFCFLVLPFGNVVADGATQAELVNSLRNGGFTIYFRHAATDWSQSDTVREPGDWRSCDGSRMRQLSEAGRLTAKRIGEAIKALAIPVGEVLSSEYCRAVETAEGLNLGPITSTTDIMNMRAAEFIGGREAAIGRFRSIIAIPPRKGTNRVISAHGNLSREATGAYPAEAGAVIFVADPRAEHGFRVVDQLEPSEWSRLGDLNPSSQ